MTTEPTRRHRQYRHKAGRAPRMLVTDQGECASMDSYLESDAATWLLYQPEIKCVFDQPSPIFCELLNGRGQLKMAEWNPDFETVNSDGEITLWEIKPRARVTQKLLERLSIFRKQAEKQGYRARLLTDRDFRIGHRMRNLHLVYHYVKLPDPGRLAWERVLSHLPATFTLEEARNACVQEELPAGHAYRAIWYRSFVFDLEREWLSPETLLRHATSRARN